MHIKKPKQLKELTYIGYHVSNLKETHHIKINSKGVKQQLVQEIDQEEHWSTKPVPKCA